MTNDIRDANLEDAVPCFALSKNNSYVMSASGGKVSLFNLATFKVNCVFSYMNLCTCGKKRLSGFFPGADHDNVHAPTTGSNISCFSSGGQ